MPGHLPEDTFNYTILGVVGSVFTFLAGIYYGTYSMLIVHYPNQAVTWLVLFLVIVPASVFLSCGFLFDSFRRLKLVQEEDQVVKKKQMIWLSISFGILGIGFLILIPAALVSSFAFSATVFFFIQASFTISSLILAAIVYGLIKYQEKLSHDDHTKSEPVTSSVQLQVSDSFIEEQGNPASLKSLIKNRQKFGEYDEVILSSFFDQR